MDKRAARTILYFLLTAVGTAFLLFYIKKAGANVVYSDYIRIINEYLPDVTNLRKLLVPDVLTRIPMSFAERLVNVKLFGYSVTFERVLAVVGIALMGVILALFAIGRDVGPFWFTGCMLLLFSLNKWEILLNGTAWAHLVSFGLFFLTYLVLDSYVVSSVKGQYRAAVKPYRKRLLVLLPIVSLLFAGEYYASFAATLLLIYLILMVRDDTKPFRLPFFTVLACLALYLVSRSFAVWEHAGATELGIFEVIAERPLFLPQFFVKTFASDVLGVETLQHYFHGAAAQETAALVLGFVVIAGYLLAYYLYFSRRMFRKTLFPFALLVSGTVNHFLVTAGRWIFLDSSYALSSRYCGQFMIGTIGMLLIFALSWSERVGRRAAFLKKLRKPLVLAVSIVLVAGNVVTSIGELGKAKYREANYEHMAELLTGHKNYETEELCKALEWHKDPKELESAIRILEENSLNVFKGK